MRKKILVTGIVAILLLPVFLKSMRGCRKEEQHGVVALVPSVQAEAYLVRDTVVPFSLRAVGYLKANETVDVVSELSGRVVSVLFREGSLVRKGDLIFGLDDSEYQASLLKNRAQLELALQAEARNADLLQSGGISQHLYEESVSHRKVLEAEGEWLKVMIGKMAVKAPFSGRTGIRNVSPGAFVTPGQVLTRLEDLSALEVEFTVPQNQSGFIRKGDPLVFSVSGSREEYQAVVEAYDPSVDRHTGTLRVLARASAAAGGLMPGTAVTVSMVNKPEHPSLYIPAQALLPVPSGYRVYSVRGGICSVVPVTTGLRSEGMAEITSGIAVGDTLLMTGFMKVKPGTKVQIVKTW